MYERTLHSAVRYLATVPRHTVPIRDLWDAVTKESRASNIEECALPDFAALLEADARFAILENGFDPEEIDLDLMDDEGRELLDLGFSPLCLVTLRREPEGEDSEEMPSIVHKHFSETKPLKVPGDRSSNGRTRRSRPRRGSSDASRTKKQGARRRRA